MNGYHVTEEWLGFICTLDLTALAKHIMAVTSVLCDVYAFWVCLLHLTDVSIENSWIVLGAWRADAHEQRHIKPNKF